MRKTFLVMLNEISASLRRKTFVLFAFILPIVLGVIALIVILVRGDAMPAASPPTEAVAAEARSEGYVDAGDLIRSLPDNIPTGWLTEYATESAAQTALEAGDITGYYVISPDYVETGDLTYVTREHNPVSEGVNTGGIEWILLVNMLGGDEQLAADVRQPLDVQETSLAVAEQASAEDNWMVELFPTLMVLLLYMVILIPAGVLVNAVTDEKKNRVMEVLMTSVSIRQIITSKIVALGLLGLLQTAVWIGVMWGVITFGGQSLNIPAGFEIPTHLIVWSLVYFLLGYAIYGAQMAGVGALAPDFKETRSAALIVMAPMIIGYMFNIVVIDSPDGAIALAVSLFPLTSQVGMIARMSVTEVPLWQSVLAAVLQLLTAIFVVRLVARLFRAQFLLSGQPFSARRYFSALAGRA